jgi:hypothetical protein
MQWDSGVTEPQGMACPPSESSGVVPDEMGEGLPGSLPGCGRAWPPSSDVWTPS